MLANWEIPEANVDVLTEARARLTAALDASGRSKAPKHAAHAQVMFDCWVEEQEENIQPEDIAACRDAFFIAIAAVEEALRPPPAPEPVAAEPEPEPEPMALPEVEAPSTHYVIYFDSALISSDASGTIGDAAVEDHQRHRIGPYRPRRRIDLQYGSGAATGASRGR